MNNGTKTILVADDHSITSEMICAVLETAGYGVIAAGDGIEATQRAYHESPDLILLDLFMPRMNGYQVCRLLKSDPVVAGIPILILTASDSRSDEFWSLQAGANHFLTKNGSRVALLTAVEQLLQEEPVPSHATISPPGLEELLTKVSGLLDRELYSTVERIELKTILQNLTEGLLTFDTQGRITSANPAFCGMLEATEAELLNQQFQGALSSRAGDDTLTVFKQAFTGKTDDAHDSIDSILHGRAGRITPVSIGAAILRNFFGNAIGCVCLFQDISRRKEIETLYATQTELYQKQTALYEELCRVNQLKNDLANMIVHDLRTPLTSLLTGLLSMEYLGELNADQSELMHISIDGGQTLLGMINDLLDIGKMEDGSLRMNSQELDAAQLMEPALKQVAALAAHKRLTLESEIAPELPRMCADRDKLQRTFINLLGNAIKFTSAGGTITVSARLQEEGKAILFTVHDTGEGIPQTAFGHIFEKFGQVATRTSGLTASTGLGLTFCKMIVEAHGGRIWVESELGRGSTFFFTVPLTLVANAQMAE